MGSWLPGKEFDDAGIDTPGNLILVGRFDQQGTLRGVGQEPGLHHDGGTLGIAQHKKIFRLRPPVFVAQLVDQLLLHQGGQAAAFGRTGIIENLRPLTVGRGEAVQVNADEKTGVVVVARSRRACSSFLLVQPGLSPSRS